MRKGTPGAFCASFRPDPFVHAAPKAFSDGVGTGGHGAADLATASGSLPSAAARGEGTPPACAAGAVCSGVLGKGGG